jgi:hypothetical protein
MRKTSSRKATKQHGKSAIGNIIVLAMIGFGIFFGIQYIPQRIEAGTMQSILDGVQRRHDSAPIRDTQDAWNVIGNQLNINNINDMREHFKVTQDGRSVVVTARYERELNLLFTTRKVVFNEQVVLD